MRVILDTNLLLRYLRSPAPGASATGALIRAALARAFTLLFVDAVIEEIERKVRERLDLAGRIPRASIADLAATLRAVAESVARLSEPYPSVARDRKDDFLIAHAVLAAADYLVTWDNDLLVLGEIEGVIIVNPAVFLDVLRAAGLLPRQESDG